MSSHPSEDHQWAMAFDHQWAMLKDVVLSWQHKASGLEATLAFC